MSQESESFLQKILCLVTGCQNETKDIQVHSKKFGDFLAWSSLNGTVHKPHGCEHCYDIMVYPDGSTSSRRKKRSDTLSPNFSRQLPMDDSFYPTFLSLKLKVYLSTSWKVSLIMYFSTTYPSSIYKFWNMKSSVWAAIGFKVF